MQTALRFQNFRLPFPWKGLKELVYWSIFPKRRPAALHLLHYKNISASTRCKRTISWPLLLPLIFSKTNLKMFSFFRNSFCDAIVGTESRLNPACSWIDTWLQKRWTFELLGNTACTPHLLSLRTSWRNGRDGAVGYGAYMKESDLLVWVSTIILRQATLHVSW